MSAGTLKVAIQQASRFSRLEDWELALLCAALDNLTVTDCRARLYDEILQELRDRHA